MQNGVACAELGDTIDGKFFLALLPGAILIAMFRSARGRKREELAR